MATEMNKTYNPSEIEDRLYKKWMDKKYFHAEVDRSKKPFTIVMPPPNITGQLHAWRRRVYGIPGPDKSECFSSGRGTHVGRN